MGTPLKITIFLGKYSHFRLIVGEEPYLWVKCKGRVFSLLRLLPEVPAAAQPGNNFFFSRPIHFSRLFHVPVRERSFAYIMAPTNNKHQRDPHSCCSRSSSPIYPVTAAVIVLLSKMFRKRILLHAFNNECIPCIIIMFCWHALKLFQHPDHSCTFILVSSVLTWRRKDAHW